MKLGGRSRGAVASFLRMSRGSYVPIEESAKIEDGDDLPTDMPW